MSKVFIDGQMVYNKDGSIDKRCKEYKIVKKHYLNMLAHGLKIQDTYPQVAAKYKKCATRGLNNIGVPIKKYIS